MSAELLIWSALIFAAGLVIGAWLDKNWKRLGG